MNFVGVIGDMGSGKTNLITAILKISNDLDRPIIANYHLKFPSTLMSFDEFQKFPESVIDCDIGMDELGTGADSYDFMSKKSQDITKLVTQLRKRHSMVYYSVQRFKFIARRLRQITDGFIFMNDLDSHLDHRKVGFICEGIFRTEFLDSDGYETRPPQLFDGRPYRDLYDTDEIIW